MSSVALGKSPQLELKQTTLNAQNAILVVNLVSTFLLGSSPAKQPK